MPAACPTFGFRVGMSIAEHLADDARDVLLADWIGFLERRGLYCGGVGAAARLEYVVASEASQAIDADRVATREWLESRAEVRSWEVGELEDLDAAR